VKPHGNQHQSARKRSPRSGLVQLVEVANDARQDQAVIAELGRLRQLGVSDWFNIAVLSREHTDLAQVRTLAERQSIPIRWVAGRSAMPPLHQIREINRFLSELARDRSSFKRASDLREIASKMFAGFPANVWTQFLGRLLSAWENESGNAEVPVQEALEFLYEACSAGRSEFSYGEGVTLSTVHSAKGTEYDHVLLIGPWRMSSARAQQEEERRTFYVGMTRARKTLAVFDRTDVRPSFPQQMNGRGTHRYQFRAQVSSPATWLNYKMLALEDIHLGYPGHFGPNHRIHHALAALNPGDKLMMRSLPGNGLGLFVCGDTCVARFSRSAQTDWAEKLGSVSEVNVLAMLRRSAEQDTDECRRKGYLVPEWEIPVVEVVLRFPTGTEQS